MPPTTHPPKTPFHTTRTIALTLLTLFLALNIHELGHTAAAWLAGDHHASYELHCAPAGFGCNHFSPTGMSTAAKLAVTCGGVLVTQVITWSLYFLRKRTGKSWLTPLTAVFAVDPLLQFTQAALTPLPEHDLTKVDFTAAATLLGWSQPFSLAVFVVCGLAYAAVWVRLGYRARS
ncbi:hypothetical protein [Umezawaea tangerina]|uniref:Peptidase M50B-like protein n=1 Tax=Umezawaea tangerina TaxID=84725 RepID=A0A2T0SQE2_9PSEU|nr:hypothetical protein [Umezawaea tangerina]PRY35628.1 hypothetical protein CLV43_11355 [Umezawaea tangerina]